MAASEMPPHERAAAVYCRGPLLDAVQRARIFDDGKHFVDMPMRRNPEDVLQAFERLPAPERRDPARLRAFVAEHFDEPGAELQPCSESGAPAAPPFVAAGGLRHAALRGFARALHGLWPTLCRVTAPSVAAAPHRTSALPRKSPMVLPGGRFRETYYWDSLWIVHGLLASGMLVLARGLVQNLLDDVRDFGFVPNGGRIYYLNRSQPPMLHAMVAAVAERMDGAQEAAWLPGALQGLEREYEWWMSEENGHAVTLDGYRLNRYYALWEEPRPESYLEDVLAANGSRAVLRQLASVAETGWDFSSRWSRRGGRIGSCRYGLNSSEVTRVLPVDLNAIMYRFELNLAVMSEAVASGARLQSIPRGVQALRDPQARAYAAAAARRRRALDALFWQAGLGRWADVWLSEEGASSVAEVAGIARARAPTLADIAVPLWAGAADADQAAESLIALRDSGLLGPGGASTTGIASGQQWDAPNAWPPLQSMLIEGLEATGSPAGAELALDIARRWVGTCFAAWRATGFMHEKYDADDFGRGGVGGEYEPQVGFGWSNGVVLQLLERFGDRLLLPGGGFLARPAVPSGPWPPRILRLSSL